MPRGRPHRQVRDIVARNLRRLLAVHGLSVATLAEDAGVDRSNLYEVLRRGQAVTVDTLGHLADALGCDVAEFFET